MDTPFLLIGTGLLGAILTTGFAPYLTDSPPDVLTTLCTLVVSAGFVLTGSLWLHQPDLNSVAPRQIPAVTLIVLAISSTVVAFDAFRPFQSTATQGLRAIMLVVVILAAGCAAVAGWQWFRHHNLGSPIGVLITILSFGMARIVYSFADYTWSVSISPLVIFITFLGAVVLGLAAEHQVERYSNS